MQYGDIYLITSPSGKQYVGQCVKFLVNGKRWGYLNRWQQHKRDAFDPNKNYCRLLNNAIRKYGADNMKIELIDECLVEELDFFENYYIELGCETMAPNGYNLISGKTNSRQSKETRDRRRVSMMGKNKGKRHPKRVRKYKQDNILPKYVRCYRDNSGKMGYRVCNHPKLKGRSFVSKYETMDSKLKKALEYIQMADNK